MTIAYMWHDIMLQNINMGFYELKKLIKTLGMDMINVERIFGEDLTKEKPLICSSGPISYECSCYGTVSTKDF